MLKKFELKNCEILMKFQGFISLITTLPHNRSQFLYKSTIQKFWILKCLSQISIKIRFSIF